MITRGSGEFEATVIDDDQTEYDVIVRYKGYSDPGVLSGPVERCYPPEGEMEIEVKGLPDGVTVSDKEQERLEQIAYEHLEYDERNL